MSEWKLVPVDPTEEMNKAGMRWLTGIQHMRAGDKRNALNEAFKAMAALAPQPQALGGELEVLATLILGGIFDSRELGDNDIQCAMGAVEALQQKLVTTSDDVHVELVDRAHVTRLQAEVSQLRQHKNDFMEAAEETRKALQAEVAQHFEDNAELGRECSRLNRRTAELEGLLRDIEKRYWSVEFDLPADLLGKLKALSKGKCCQPTAEGLAALQAGDCTPEELWGGSRPTCPKCHDNSNALAGGKEHGANWRDPETAPKDGTLLCLLVEFSEHSTEDEEQAPTIGANNFDNDGLDEWKFAGWCWSHDHFVQGIGKVVGWLPFIDRKLTEGADEAPKATDKDIERWHDLVTRHPDGPWQFDSFGKQGVKPASDELLAELADWLRMGYTPWNVRSTPLSPRDRQFMYLLYCSVQGLVSRVRHAERTALAAHQSAAARTAELEGLLREVSEWFDDGVGRSDAEYQLLCKMRAALAEGKEHD